MNILKHYLKYKFTAKGRHGIHSPFVYTLVDQCLRKKMPPSAANAFLTYISKLKANHKKIAIVDLGAGSHKLSNERKVSSIAKVSGTGIKYGKLLYKLVAFYQPKRILELGTSVGIGTHLMHLAKKDAEIHTVEGCPNTLEVAKQALTEAKVNNIHFYSSSFVEFLKSCSLTFDFVFIDGDHRGESLLQQLELLQPLIHDETLIVLDDIRWSDDMYKTWEKIIHSTNYSLSIDLFRMGIIARRPKQFKEHFVVNY